MRTATKNLAILASAAVLTVIALTSVGAQQSPDFFKLEREGERSFAQRCRHSPWSTRVSERICR